MSVVDHITNLDVIQRTSLHELARRITAPSPQPAFRSAPASRAEVPNAVTLGAALTQKCLLTVMFGSRKTDTSAIERLAARLLSSLEGEGEGSVNGLWEPAAVLGAVALVWALTAVILVLASRRHRVSLAIRCPMFRRNVQVTGDEWGGQLLDVRRCSGLQSSTDFELCRMTCLEPDECAAATLGLPGNLLFKGGGV